MSSKLIESLQSTTQAAAERNAAEAAVRSAEAIIEERNASKEKTKQIRQKVKHEVAASIGKLTFSAESAAAKGKTSISEDWGRGWQTIRPPEGLDEELEVATAVRDKVAKHFTALEFQVTLIDEHKSIPIEKLPEDEGYYNSAYTQRIIGVEIAWDSQAV